MKFVKFKFSDNVLPIWVEYDDNTPIYDATICGFGFGKNSGNNLTGKEVYVHVKCKDDTYCGNCCQCKCYVTSDLIDLFFAFVATFGKSFQLRDCNRQQLHNDGCVDVRGDAECKNCAVRQCATTDGIENAKQIVTF